MAIAKLIIVSIKQHNHYNEILDTIARGAMEVLQENCDKDSQMGSGGISQDGWAVWRVSSLPDMATRLSHLEEKSVSALDIVVHASRDGFRIGDNDWIGISDVGRLDFVSACLSNKAVVRLVGCNLGGQDPAGNQEKAASVPKKLAVSWGVTVKAPLEPVRTFDPSIAVKETRYQSVGKPLPRDWRVIHSDGREALGQYEYEFKAEHVTGWSETIDHASQVEVWIEDSGPGKWQARTINPLAFEKATLMESSKEGALLRFARKKKCLPTYGYVIDSGVVVHAKYADWFVPFQEGE